MKAKLFFLSLLLISSSSFGKNVYTLSIADFTDQFDRNTSLKRVYCLNEKNEKVWLFCYDYTRLILVFKNGKREKLLLPTIRYYDGKVQASRLMAWNPDRDTSIFNLNEVASLLIIREFFREYEMTYFNAKDSINLANQRNDSLKQIYISTKKNEILITQRLNTKIDSFRIIENACYNLTFVDGVETNFGFVQKISADSIYIFNHFNNRIAIRFKKDFLLLSYPISSIKKISLLNSNGRSFSQVQIDPINIIVRSVEPTVSNIPFWYAVDYRTGEISLYRQLQTANWFAGITENRGSIVWYEGE